MIFKVNEIKYKIEFKRRGSRRTTCNILSCNNSIGEWLTKYSGWARRSKEDRKPDWEIGRRQSLRKALSTFDPEIRKLVWKQYFSRSPKFHHELRRLEQSDEIK